MTSATKRTAHTPGPWEIHEWGDYEIEILGRNGLICDLAQSYHDKSGQGENAFIDADARLIAAAPELLEALRRAVEHADSHDDYDWIGAAVAAIKKVEGEK